MQLHFKSPSGRFGGFTLIEIMVVIGIITILVAVALPSYTSYIARARRADARTQLVQAAQFAQRFYSSNDRFDVDRAGNALLTQIPAGLMQSPADSSALYTLEIPTATASTYELRMVPVATASMASDKCGAFTLTSSGVRGVWVGGAAGDLEQRNLCWK